MARHKVGIKQRQPGMGSHPLMRYDQAVLTLTGGSLAVGSDKQATLFDNSGTAGNKYLKIGKMTLQWFLNFNEQNLLYFAVWKAGEGATALSLDDETEIRNMRSEGRLIRGPWQTTTRGPGIGSANVITQMKTIVLEDLLLDPDDDLMFGYTVRGPLGSASGTNDIYLFSRTFWKVTE